MPKITFLKTLAAASIALAPASAVAEPSGPSRSISYADLDLSRASDVTKLRRRIALAMESVCGSYATVEPYRADEITRCRAQAKAGVDQQLAQIAERQAVRLAGVNMVPTE